MERQTEHGEKEQQPYYSQSQAASFCGICGDHGLLDNPTFMGCQTLVEGYDNSKIDETASSRSRLVQASTGAGAH
jgi:hypothetical protein